MKALFIVYNQAYNQEIADILEQMGQRGYTVWNGIGGRGSVDGEPHLGSHARPTQNHAMMSVMEDSLAAGVMKKLREVDVQNPRLGLRAYSFSVDEEL